MGSEQTIWTVLPFRRHADRLGVSVLVSPRLTPDEKPGKLGEFGSWLDWPAIVRDLSFQLEFESGPGVSASFADDAQSPDSDLWQRLFEADMPLTPFTFADLSARRVHSFPVATVRRQIEEQYRRIAANSPTDFPLLEGTGDDGLQGFLDAFGEVQSNYDRYRHDLPEKPEDVAESEFGLVQALGFYSRARLGDGPDAYPAIEKPHIDFHQALASLSDHPTLSERLGIVLVLDTVHADVPPTGTVRLHRDALPPGAICPQTAYALDDERFLPQPQVVDGALAPGFLRLGQGDRFDLHQLDVDGAALKVIQFAHAMSHPGGARNFASPDRESVPALRSAGLTVSMNDRGVELIARLKHNSELDVELRNDTAVLWAQDVLRGYRLDVRDEEDVERRWRSLHHRAITYVVGRDHAEELVEHEEGYVKGSTATVAAKDDPNAAKDDPKPDMYVHEALFGWEGWSLSGPRPGNTISHDMGAQAEPVQPESVPFDEFPLTSHPRVTPGSLPRLRYGRRYALRARTVDLAGRGLPDDVADDANATQTVVYRRFDPVQGPTLVRRHRDTEGESLERLVIRSDVGMSPAEYAARPDVVAALAAAGQSRRRAATSERHVAAPKVSQLIAEQHGMFDPDAFDGDSPGAAYAVARKESGTFVSEQIWDPVSEAYIDVQGIVWEPAAPPPPGDGNPPAPGQYMLNVAERVRLPYLPDPIALGVSFLGLPGVDPDSPLLVEWQAPVWHDPAPFRLVLAGGDGEPVMGADLEVFLPPSGVARVRMSSYIAGDDLELMGIWGLLDAAERAAVEQIAGDGRHWMLTPYREVTLVHAVQRPLEAPVMTCTSYGRMEGSTWAPLAGVPMIDATMAQLIACHGASTARLDVTATWTEYLDLLSEDAPSETDGHARPAGYDVPAGQNVITMRREEFMRHEFGDTKHRVVSYRAIATTRFREYFPEAITSNPFNITQTSEPVAVIVPSSARPATPVVRQLLPTFAWVDEQDTPDLKKRTRRGGGVRVYLARPWFSSGGGEELAVLLRSSASDDPGGGGDPLTPFVSDWGLDPVWLSAAPQRPLRPEHFPARTLGGVVGLTLQELPELIKWWEGTIAFTGRRTVTAVPHPVHYDTERELWYCDIELDSGQAYMPFVRLAVARYQHQSINDCHLSPVVLTDFVQLQPQRTAQLQFSQSAVFVTLSGPFGENRLGSGQHSAARPEAASLESLSGGRLVEAVLERYDTGSGDELGWLPYEDVELAATELKDGVATWQGTLNLPAGARESGKYRILVAEHEHYHSDKETADPDISIRELHAEQVTPVGSRIIYADRFSL